MKNFFLLSFVLSSCFFSAQTKNLQTNAVITTVPTVSVSPTPFQENQSITLTFSNVNTTQLGSTNLYLWTWAQDFNGNNIPNTTQPTTTDGAWASNSVAAVKLTQTGSNSFIFTLTPTTFFGVANIGKIGMLIRTINGSQQTQDLYVSVGSFTASLVTPAEDSNTVVSAGTSFPIQATNTGGAANYELSANGTVISTQTGVTSFSYNEIVNENRFYTLKISQGTAIITKKFSALVNQTVQQAMPSGLENGINYNTSDPTKATLVLDAPYKDFVLVAGSFNNWSPTAAYTMKQDPSSGKFWLELTGLTAGQVYTFQYFTFQSAKLVRVADPFSTLVLAPDDDPWIPESIYPNMPQYPDGQAYDVSVLQTNQPEYQWQVTGFQHPNKDKLVIYELLLRDFTDEQSWQAAIDKFNHLKSLNINAIELMPIMEFEGNNSWGYNTTFHMAIDKAYGHADKMKEFIDLCHQNGIAVILDLAINHAYGRSPLVRMWSTSTTGDYGDPNSQNPYFNTHAMHAYSVGSDFNHQSARTQYYVQRVLNHWIKDFKVDGIRWDLVKGFTQNCSDMSESCTNAYQQDRVDIIKKYADFQWADDPDSYVILEHLGTSSEHQAWANYKDGMMPWIKQSDPFYQTSMGWGTSSDLSWLDSNKQGFNNLRADGYAESHDEERVMYKTLASGNAYGSYNVKTLATALDRQKAIGAVLFSTPGPKMIWEFEELGYDKSINLCSNGTISSGCRTDPKPSALGATLNYSNVAARKDIYDTWAKIIKLKTQMKVFSSKDFTFTYNNNNYSNLLPIIKIQDTSISDSDPANVSKVVVVANFDVTLQSVTPQFPLTGTWYDLLTNATLNVTSTGQSVTLQPGEFHIYGNKKNTLGTEDVIVKPDNNAVTLTVLQNPTQNKTAKIAYSAPKASTVTLSVYNFNGALLKTVRLKKEGGTADVPMNYPAGSYILLLNSDAGKANAKVLLK
ncbi:MAG: T9SS type A sorting domain-containing protein [Flavobacteriaceae bacterium]|jgi:glycosidase|nr:T9SS type A sorting domain-containing protein [Flavobacteriaceae bacterium]